MTAHTWDGDVLFVDGVEVGYASRDRDGFGIIRYKLRTLWVHDATTARAVLLALAGIDPGKTFVLTLAEAWTRAGLELARKAGLGDYLAPLLEDWAGGLDTEQHTDEIEDVQKWWSGGYFALNIRAVERSDDNPF